MWTKKQLQAITACCNKPESFPIWSKDIVWQGGFAYATNGALIVRIECECEPGFNTEVKSPLRSFFELDVKESKPYAFFDPNELRKALRVFDAFGCKVLMSHHDNVINMIADVDLTQPKIEAVLMQCRR